MPRASISTRVRGTGALTVTGTVGARGVLSLAGGVTNVASHSCGTGVLFAS